jgi:hypothetical protein
VRVVARKQQLRSNFAEEQALIGASAAQADTAACVGGGVRLIARSNIPAAITRSQSGVVIRQIELIDHAGTG